MSDWRPNTLGSAPPLSASAVWETPAPAPERPLLHLFLFFLTLFSMAAAGAMQQGVDPLASLPYSLVHLVEGLPFAGALLGILTVHEFGHYFAARRWGVKATLPFFLPLPYLSIFGTLGAVIRMYDSPSHRIMPPVHARNATCPFDLRNIDNKFLQLLIVTLAWLQLLLLLSHRL